MAKATRGTFGQAQTFSPVAIVAVPTIPTQAPIEVAPAGSVDTWNDAQLAARVAAIGDPRARLEALNTDWIKRREALAAHVKAEERAISELADAMRREQRAVSGKLEELRLIGVEQSRRGALAAKQAKIAAEAEQVKMAREAKKAAA